ncbi:HAE1 family hydrophobic/amphiphilic exporter-1 [Anaerobacterium chartisolvens]|uniref:HAE1 family hydrophobic/amphiphilic exporter-1 n=1 Tax=Anaerobacterium chartisolvens TaxID=1297424 RepID=A0A369B4C4_9FIRM|nr:efflux RND transporter permease subunit [Anaerobacterium chartisolvens]RCX15448.1 HAE1 family hydrophobic/amphiphilic exporter-1 [Anaerobacterium chartisolvens]
MNISELSIKRPVTIIMCMLIVVVFGAVSFMRIPMDLMPSMDLPMAIVSTTYSGVGPEEVENFVTKNVESAMATVNNMKSIRSQTSEGTSIVMVEFTDGTDMNFATLQMREKLDLIKNYLPDGVENPMVLKLDPNMLPVAQVGVSSEKGDAVELKEFVEDTIKARIERLEGVASVQVSGGAEREIKVEVDPARMAGYGVPFSQVINILQMENINQPGGSVEYGSKELIVKSKGEFSSVEDIKNIPITMPGGRVIYIRDLANVQDSVKTQSTYTRMNGKDSVGISVQKQTTANTVKVVNLVKQEINKIKSENPGINISIVFDQGMYIEKSIGSVASNALVGAVLAIIILFIFLKNFRTTLIIAIAIPVSIISTFILMFLSNTSLNIISMGGLALGVGMMVDSSIVVLENIFRHRQSGETVINAAIKGAKEVGGAIIASTLTTVVVFVPIIFTEGMAAEIFKEMALTVTFSLLASLVVALTVVPMLSSKMLKISSNDKEKKSILNKIFDGWGRLFDRVDEVYRKILKTVLRRRAVTALVVITVFILSIAAVPLIGIEFIPETDQGQFIVNISLAEGTNIENTNEIANRVEEIIASVPEVEKIFVSVGGSSEMGISTSSESNIASIDTTLVALNQRKRSTANIVEEVREQVKNIPGANIEVSNISMSMGGMGGSPISIEISGYDLDQLKAISWEVEEKVKGVEGTREIQSSVSKGRPEAHIYVDRDKASQYGINTMMVASAVRSALEGQVATRYRVGGDEIDVRIQFPQNEAKTFEQLKSINISAPNGANLALSDVVKIELKEGPVSITRNNQTRLVTVTSNLYGRDVGSATSELMEAVGEIPLPEGYSLTFAGQNKQIEDSFTSLGLALLLSIVLIYMVMAAQFESLLQPFIIMFSVPIAFSGAAIGLLLTGRTFNVAAFIGIIMLSGIVVNNAIILIDYINQLRRGGLGKDEAIIKGGPTRLRPIMMTTLTTVLGMIPLAIGIGEGSEIQSPLATVIVFGLSLSTLVTLLIVPVVYSLLDDLHNRIRGRKRKGERPSIA